MVWWFSVPKVVFGEDALTTELEQLSGKNAFILTDKVVMGFGFPERISEILHDHQWSVAIWDNAEPDPRVSSVKSAAEAMRRFSTDTIIAVGGGSVMDTAKAAWVLYEHPEIQLEAITPLQPLDLRHKARLVCIPTTAGTGSEATKAVVIREDQTGRKFATNNAELCPDIAILEPGFVKGLPKELTAYTGLDALTHAVEAYVSVWKNDFSDACTLKTVQMVFEWLPKSVADLTDLQAREKMLIAADLAGMSFSNSQVALGHSLGHSLGSVLRVQHGLAVGLSLPLTIEYNCKDKPETAKLYAELAALVGIKKADPELAARAFAKKIRQLQASVGFPTSLKKAGVSEKDFNDGLDKLVQYAMMDSSITMNPRDIDSGGIRKMYEYMYSGTPVDF